MAGYWKGSATQQDSNRTFDAVALIDAEGNAQWVLTRGSLLSDDGFVVSANVCCAAQFADAVTGKELGETRTRDGNIDATVDGSVLGGELRFHDEDYRFTLNASSDYNSSTSLAQLAGVYTRRDNTILGENVTLTMTIEADGRLTGSSRTAACSTAAHRFQTPRTTWCSCRSTWRTAVAGAARSNGTALTRDSACCSRATRFSTTASSAQPGSGRRA
jgi:hypothetical protein